MPTTIDPCDSNPFMLLGDGARAPVLDYGMPQKSCMPLSSVLPIQLREDVFLEEYSKTTEDTWWERLSDRSAANIKRILRNEIEQGGESRFIENFHLITNSAVPIVFHDQASAVEGSFATYFDAAGQLRAVAGMAGDVAGVKYMAATQLASTMPAAGPAEKRARDKAMEMPVAAQAAEVAHLAIPSEAAVEIDIDAMSQRLSEGLIAVCIATADGKLTFRYREREAQRTAPSFYLVYELEQCSYLGNYGAGDTVSTFSLLPGEKTTISVETYQHNSVQSSRAQNVLDSMSESSLNSFERELQEQSASQSSSSSSNGVTSPGTVSTSGWNLLIWNSRKTRSKPSTTKSSVSHVAKMKSSVSNSLAKTVSQSNHQRHVNINFSSESSTQEGTSTYTVRELQNINLSRTLNFAVRQLVQEHIALLWLRDIRIVFSNGQITEEARIEDIEGLVSSYVQANAVKDVIEFILNQITHIRDYKGNMTQFLECHEFEVPAIECECREEKLGGISHCFWGKRDDIETTYEDYTVPGILLDVSTHVLRTPSVIVDALLGQGNALDCHNTHLQQLNVESQRISNRRMEQAIEVIDGIGSAEEKARLYKSVFGECCPGEKKEE